jgi:hypothetical protein
MLDFFAKFFSYKAKSMEEFVKAIREQRCRAVSITPHVKSSKWPVETMVVGTIGDFQYELEFVAINPRGRRIVYRSHMFTRFGSSSGFADSEERGKAAMKGLLLAERESAKLQAQLPEVIVGIVGPQGPIDKPLLELLHEEAKKRGVFI